MAESTKQKLSIAHTGKIISKETKKRLSESHKGHIHSEEHKRKISYALKGRTTYGLNHAEKLRKSRMKVVQQYTIEGKLITEFESIKKADDSLNTISKNWPNIIACCNGKQKTCKGYKWKYKYGI